MKIIDLLNKIANGEEVPNKILQHCECFDEDKEWQLTKRSPKCYEAVYKDWERDDSEFLFDYLTTDMLNDEVEIIEDKSEPKPITKKDLEALGYAFGEMRKALQNGWNKSLNNEPFKEGEKIEKIKVKSNFTHNQKQIVRKINEIIDYINKGDK